MNLSRIKNKNFIFLPLKLVSLIFIAIFIFAAMLLFSEPFIKDGQAPTRENSINNFEECAAAGYPIIESYPRQCVVNGETFVENIGNELEKGDLIRPSYPRPNQEIESPLIVRGEARGYWFFEGDFPFVLVNWDGLIIAEGYASAKGDWMTEDFVEFEGRIEFKKPDVYNNGALILRKDNPSGLPEYDDALEIPIVFK